MKTLATLAIMAVLAGCTQAQRDAWNQPMDPAALQGLAIISQNFQQQMYQNQMLNLQRQQLYNTQRAQQAARRPIQCFNLGGVIQCQ